jgi:hypothetical protein
MKKEKILRIRPFNMANFSGGSGYMPLFAIFGMIISIPATLFLWTGFALSLKKKEGTLDYQILKRRLKRVLLPICLVLFVSWFIFLLTTIYGNTLFYVIATLWGAAIPTIGIYCSIFFSTKLLNNKNKLSKGKWLLLTLIFMMVLIIIGYIIFFILTGISEQLDSLFYRMI